MGWLYNLFYANKDKQIADLQSQIDLLNKSVYDLQNKLSLLSQPPIDSPQVLGRLSNNDVFNVIRAVTGVSEINLSDTIYDLTSKDLAQQYVIKSKIWTQKWVSESHDCDNFSYEMAGYWSESLKSFALGIAWSSNHAFNFMIDDKRQLWIVEPQTSQFMTWEDAKKQPLDYINWRFAML